MIQTEPKIFLISTPQLDWAEVRDYLHEIGGLAWYDRITGGFSGKLEDADLPFLSDAEALVEFHARNCYRSFDVGLNPNVTKVRTDSADYFENIKQSKHGSVFEHANFSFVFHNVSRVFTHELVRHRAGVAISQESLRYVRLTELKFRIPEILEPMRNQVISIVETLEEFQKEAAETFGLDDNDSPVPFSVKKEVTSALRRLAPLGLSTTIGWTANVRTIRHVLEQRTAQGAEEEIRTVFRKVGLRLRDEYPFLFGDYILDSDGAFTTPFGKV